MFVENILLQENMGWQRGHVVRSPLQNPLCWLLVHAIALEGWPPRVAGWARALPLQTSGRRPWLQTRQLSFWAEKISSWLCVWLRRSLAPPPTGSLSRSCSSNPPQSGPQLLRLLGRSTRGRGTRRIARRLENCSTFGFWVWTAPVPTRVVNHWRCKDFFRGMCQKPRTNQTTMASVSFGSMGRLYRFYLYYNKTIMY